MNNLRKLKNRLITLQKELKERIAELSKPPEFGSDTYDAETFESQAFVNQLSMAEDLKKDLMEIEAALAKMEKGKYGICEKCGRKFSVDLLEVAPESRWCRECKKKISR